MRDSSRGRRSENRWNSPIPLRGADLVALSLACIPFALQAQTTISFDDPGYIAGQAPPPPWVMGDAQGRIQQGAGTSGSQALGMTVGTATCFFPGPLSPTDGATRISVSARLPNDASAAHPPLINDVTLAEVLLYTGIPGRYVQVQWDLQDPHAQIPRHADEFVVRINQKARAYFTPPTGSLFYELRFDFPADWKSVTVTLRDPAGFNSSSTLPWDGTAVDRIALGGNGFAACAYRLGEIPTCYDNLTVKTAVARPTLQIKLTSGGKSVISWPVAATNYVLETVAGLTPTTAWQSAGIEPARVDAEFVVTNPLAANPAFFRLRRP